MAISLTRFSNVADQARIQDRGIVTVGSRQDVRLNQSRFRLVRWIANSGIGKHATNRRAVGSFVDALENHYGRRVMSHLSLDHLRNLQGSGKPLHMRVVRAAIREANETVDSLKLAESSRLGKLMDEHVESFAYLALPEGRALADEVRSKADVAWAYQEFADIQLRRSKSGELSGDLSLFTARRWAKLALSAAHEDMFLTGYGIRTNLSEKYRAELVPERLSATGRSEWHARQYEKLQDVLNGNPQARSLFAKYGLGFDASRLSGALYADLDEKLRSVAREALTHPERLPGDGPVKDRIEQAIRQKTERMVADFVRDRADAVERWYDMHRDGQTYPGDIPQLTANERAGLADVVLHRRIPPAAVPGLCALRSRVPGDLRPLTRVGHGMEDTIQVLNQLGKVVDEASTVLSDKDFRDYAAGERNRTIYADDCSRFLLEGKWSADDDFTIRHALKTDMPGANIVELCHGIAGLRDEMQRSESPRNDWSWAKGSLDGMANAVEGLLGRDAPPLMGAYTSRAGNVLDAMRNCGIFMPPPALRDAVRSGKGSFSQPGLAIAQTELQENLNQNKERSTRFPEYPGEAVRDLDRADFVVGDRKLERGDVDGIVEGIRKLCVDREGNRDERLLNIVAQLVYQRSNSLAQRRLATGADADEVDRDSKLKSAPFIGHPSADYASTYSVSRSGEDTVRVVVEQKGAPHALACPDEDASRVLDRGESRFAFDVTMEIDTRDYSTTLAGMSYDFKLVPAGGRMR